MSYSVYTEKQMYEKYGYLMDAQHGNDIELLIDILKETGSNVGRIGKLFYINE